MNLPTLKHHVSGYLTIHRIRNGKRELLVDGKKNLVLNGRLTYTAGIDGSYGKFYTFTDTAANYEDLNGTWNQSGNTVTRASGTGTFPSSPSQIGNELQWQDGERCHVTARASDTSITVSGPARTLTGKTIRRWLTNRSSVAGYSQSMGPIAGSITQNHSTGVTTHTLAALFDSATSAYSLGSVIVSSAMGYPWARVVLVAPVAVAVDDQLEMSYTIVHTNGTRNFSYQLGSESVGIPTQYTASTIVGNGTTFDIVTSIDNHFLAGDQILLENFVPKRFAISSGSSNSTTITVITTAAHGLSVADTIVIENASVGGYNGTWVVDTVVDSDTITIASALNPGALGATGTVRLATPVTYFDGTFTVASKPTAATIRVTSSIQGPAIDPKTFGSIRDVTWDLWGGASYRGRIGVSGSGMFYISEANAKPIPTPETTDNPSGIFTGVVVANSADQDENASFANDFTLAVSGTWNAGAAEPRIKQILWGNVQTNCNGGILTFAVPQSKTAADRLQAVARIQILRDLSA